MNQKCLHFFVFLNILSLSESATIKQPDETTSYITTEEPPTSDLSLETSELPTTKPWSEISSTVLYTTDTFSKTDSPSTLDYNNPTVSSERTENDSFLDTPSEELDDFQSSETFAVTENVLTTDATEETKVPLETTPDSLIEDITEATPIPTSAPTTDLGNVPNFADFMDNNINFTLRLYNSLVRTKKSQENILFSPLSIFSALLMLHYGAKGKTAEELTKVLDINALSSDIDLIHNIYGSIFESISDDPTSNSYVLMANKMFAASGFKILDQYQNGIKAYYNASVQPVNFFEQHTTSLINAWVESKTKGQISNLFKSTLPSTTASVILNALYFKGNWQYEFSPVSTVDNSKFYLDSENTVSVSMMINKVKLAYGYSWELNAGILELPYIGDRLSMFVILPNGNTTLEEVEENININSLKVLLRSMRRRVINIRLPKFQLRDTPSVVKSLKELGVESLFSGDADLSGLAEGGFAVSDIKHEATIEVGETGSVASAVTGVILERLGSSYEHHFEADHPFIFFIIDKQNGIILFMGRLANPSE